MKKLLLAATVLIAFAAVRTAGAADMPVKAPPPPPALLPSWTGFYIGGEIGGSWLRDRDTETTAFVPPLPGNATNVFNGLVGGGYAGYNWQVGRVVVGPEFDFEATSLSSTNTCLVQDFNAGNVAPGTCFAPAYAYSTSLPWRGSIRGRVGYTWTDVLFYVTGGFAFAQINTNYATMAGYVSPGAQSFSQTAGGGTVGAGLEYKLDGHWIGRMEYRYTDFGTVSNAITTGGGFWNGYTDRHRFTENTLRVGVSYLFQGPITAKY
jgi:outer membrane immunogenic protein